MTYNDMTENEEIDAASDDLDHDNDFAPVDLGEVFYELASRFAELSASEELPARHRRRYAHFSNLCDLTWLAKGEQRKTRQVEVFTQLAQLEKSLRADVQRAVA